jgi:hypothetical protein
MAIRLSGGSYADIDWKAAWPQSGPIIARAAPHRRAVAAQRLLLLAALCCADCHKLFACCWANTFDINALLGTAKHWVRHL